MMDEETIKMLRRLMFIAFVWNDHNFEKRPEEMARETLAECGIENLAQANVFLEKAMEAVQTRRDPREDRMMTDSERDSKIAAHKEVFCEKT